MSEHMSHDPHFQAALENPNAVHEQIGGMEGDSGETARDDFGNSVGEFGGMGVDSRFATYHVEGGAENGGKTYTTRMDSEGNARTKIEDGESARQFRSQEMADTVIRMAAKAVDRNSSSRAA